MKANQLQQKICDTLISTIHYWKSTNDISSPTVSSDIGDWQSVVLGDEITDYDLHLLNNYMNKILTVVRKYD